MIISDFTQNEIDFLLKICNFTDTEKELFLLRAKNVSLVECSLALHLSLDGTKKISQKINKKILRAI